jgi:pimeloyl-ACP methyl ester carboxylesterase
MPVPRPRPHLLLVLSVLALAIASARPLAPPPASPHAGFGRGTPVVLLHGLGSRREDWLPTARILARRHRVTLVDLPGHGEADMPAPFSLERATVSLDRALADVPGGPLVLVGHSLGGLIAASEALARPERVRALVLIETALRPQLPEALRAEWLERLEREYESVVRGAYLDFGRDSAQGEMLYRRVADLDPRMVRRWIRLAWTADLSQAAGRLSAPALAVLAERSWGHDEPWPDVAEALGLAGVPRLRPVRITGCGHFVMLDRPAELAALIERFAAEPAEGAVAAR